MCFNVLIPQICVGLNTIVHKTLRQLTSLSPKHSESVEPACRIRWVCMRRVAWRRPNAHSWTKAGLASTSDPLARSIDALPDCCDGARRPAWTSDMIEPMMYEKQIVPQSIAACPFVRGIYAYTPRRVRNHKKHEPSMAKYSKYHKRSASCAVRCVCALSSHAGMSAPLGMDERSRTP